MNKQLKKSIKEARSGLARKQSRDAEAMSLICALKYDAENRLRDPARVKEKVSITLRFMADRAEDVQVRWVILMMVSFVTSFVSGLSYFIENGATPAIGVGFTSVLVFAGAFYKARQAAALEHLCRRAQSFL